MKKQELLLLKFNQLLGINRHSRAPWPGANQFSFMIIYHEPDLPKKVIMQRIQNMWQLINTLLHSLSIDQFWVKSFFNFYPNCLLLLDKLPKWSGPKAPFVGMPNKWVSIPNPVPHSPYQIFSVDI